VRVLARSRALAFATARWRSGRWAGTAGPSPWLRRGVLPISKRSQDLVRDILPVTKVGDATIRAKSGLLGAELGKPSLGWMVGWAEKDSAQTVFALNMDIREPRHIPMRMTLTQQCLADIGAI